MLGVIKAIEEITDDSAGWSGMDGYKVTTDRHVVSVLISNHQDCCESWGYFASEDDLGQYIGAELQGVNLTDTALNVKKVEESGWYSGDGSIQFVDFATNVGTFQLAVYNAHNGYYGHNIRIKINDEILLEDSL